MEDNPAVEGLRRASRAAARPGSARLAYLLTRYGGAIEVDLRPLDIAELWRTRRWRWLLNLIDHLPASSQFIEAQADDEELARVLVDHLEDTPANPRLSEWGPLRAELAVIADRLGELITLFVAANGGGHMRLALRPRPVTAADRLRGQRLSAQHRALVNRLIRK